MDAKARNVLLYSHGEKTFKFILLRQKTYFLWCRSLMKDLVFGVLATRLLKTKLTRYFLLSTNDDKSQAVERDRELPGLSQPPFEINPN